MLGVQVSPPPALVWKEEQKVSWVALAFIFIAPSSGKANSTG
uniref:Uncharacterized protein n=1 Tax=Anguilla anguilla TaxID=7936 RepID=A0A0E9WKX5_ANGAN